MEIKKLTIEEVKQISTEGLILQGCGGDLSEWVDGINAMLTQCGVLKNGASFTDVSTFKNGNLKNLIFNMEGVDLDIGKLAMWRLTTHQQFGGTWASDYLPNKFGVELGAYKVVAPESTKPDCQLIGENGNIYHLMGVASRTLRKAGQSEQATEMCEKIQSSGSYEEALNIIGDYVNITAPEEPNSEMTMQFGGY